MGQVPEAALILLRTGTTPSPPGGQDSRHLILLRSVPFHSLFPGSGASGEREIQLSELRTSCPADLQKVSGIPHGDILQKGSHRCAEVFSSGVPLDLRLP